MTPAWSSPATSSAVKPWLTWTALAAMWLLTFTGQYWVYPLLFLAWAAYDLVTGESSFIQRVTRRAQPVTYWLVVSSWILLAVLWVAYPA